MTGLAASLAAVTAAVLTTQPAAAAPPAASVEPCVIVMPVDPEQSAQLPKLIQELITALTELVGGDATPDTTGVGRSDCPEGTSGTAGADEPTSPEPGNAGQPGAGGPGSSEPGSAGSGSDGSDSDESGSGGSESSESESSESESSESGSSESGSSESGSSESESSESGSGESGSSESGSGESGSGESGSGESGSGESESSESESSESGSNESESGESESESSESASDDSGSDDSGSDDSGSDDSGSGESETGGSESADSGADGEQSSDEAPTAATGTDGNAGVPGDLLDLEKWYLTLPVGPSGDPESIDQPELLTYSGEHFKLTPEGDGVVFRAHAGGVTTENSSYARSELREMAGGDEKAAWSNTSGTHTLETREAITKTPTAKPEVVAAQIHDGGDDVMQIRLEGQTLVAQYADGDEQIVIDPAYELGTPYDLRIVAANGGITVFYNGKQAAEIPRSGSSWYWKIGAYTQSNPEKGDPPDAVGEVVVYSLKVEHSGT